MGNGVIMKIAPVAMKISTEGLIRRVDNCEFIINLTCMTHKNKLATSASLSFVRAIGFCLYGQLMGEDRFTDRFIENVIDDARFNEKVLCKIQDETPSLYERLQVLKQYKDYDTPRIIKELVGSCYVYNSLPFSLMFFVKNPYSINTLYDVLNAGGDTDSNCAVVGALLGALNGMDVFPKELIEQIPEQRRWEIEDLTDRFAAAIEKG